MYSSTQTTTPYGRRAKKNYRRATKRTRTDAGTVAVYPRKNQMVYGAIRPDAIFQRSEIKEFSVNNALGGGAFTTVKFKTPPDNIPLNDVIQGTGFNNRIGSKINMLDVTIKFFSFFEPVDNLSSDVLRIMLILDRQANLNVPNWQSAMLDEAAAVTCMQDPQTSSRYKILHDYAFNARWGTNYENREYTIYKKLGVQAEYRGNSDTPYGAILSNSLTMWAVSNKSQANGNSKVAYTARIRYTDC